MLMYLGLLVVVLVVMMLMRIGRANSSPGSNSNFKFNTRNIVTAALDSRGAPTKIVFNGQEYSSVDEMPPVARAAYKLAMGLVLTDADHDGVPDLLKSVAAGRSGFIPKLGSGEVSPADPATRMKQLQDMRNSGLITNDEYEAKRTQILDKL